MNKTSSFICVLLMMPSFLGASDFNFINELKDGNTLLHVMLASPKYPISEIKKYLTQVQPNPFIRNNSGQYCFEFVENEEKKELIKTYQNYYFSMCQIDNNRHRFYSGNDPRLLDIYEGLIKIFEFEDLGNTHRTGDEIWPIEDTMNSFGSEVWAKNRFRRDLSEYLLSLPPEAVVLDIGSARGPNVVDVIMNGHSHIVINDIAIRPLAMQVGSYDEPKRSRVTVKLGTFPYELEFANNSLDAVIISYVFHYLTPQQINDGLDRVFQWLKPGGRVFIAALTPYATQISKNQLKNIESRIYSGQYDFPGFTEDPSFPNLQLLSSLHRHLARFSIVDEYYFSIHPYYTPEHENIIRDFVPGRELLFIGKHIDWLRKQYPITMGNFLQGNDQFDLYLDFIDDPRKFSGELFKILSLLQDLSTFHEALAVIIEKPQIKS